MALKPFDGKLDDAPPGLKSFDGRLDGQRSAFGEIGNQLAAGVMVELPEQTGKALQYTGDQGDTLYDLGTRIRGVGEANAPGYEPQPEAHNVVTNALAAGG